MAPTKERLHSLMHLFIACLLKLSTAAPCLPDQASSLLQLKASFIGDNLPSWQAGTDCCHHWEGVTCGMALGRVISLDLGEFDLMSSRLDPALFNLTSLRNLSLAFNDFSGALLPASGFEQLTDIIHLNLSDTNFGFQIPIGIACLKKLVTLDLSDPIHPSFSRLRSLTTINLGYNKFEGHFPTKIFQLKSLRTLDLSDNHMLSVRLTHFPAENNLETLNLAMTTAVQNSTSGANSVSSTLRLNPIAC
ncbi:hypothetical protein PAHAL_2G046600 [Panicum hallii]|uniref:Leucine-rich repeat-containing N-terminal plant-type domain-containing protein n=1 Tax=Panicum hallii TaxID=206008 RepID=A0A2S3GVX7_9POAL|nr:receptor-like protein 43 [Panicum hallii]PAN09715.1 hypothetical protein PAHAL_2G046600 [Panicum hallii]